MKTYTRKIALYKNTTSVLKDFYTTGSEYLEHSSDFTRVSEYKDVEFVMLEANPMMEQLKQTKLNIEAEIEENRLNLEETNKKLTELLKLEGIRSSNV